MRSRKQRVDVPVEIRIPIPANRSTHDLMKLHVELVNIGDAPATINSFAVTWCGERVETDAQAKRYLAARDSLRAVWTGRRKLTRSFWSLFANRMEAIKENLGFMVTDIWTAIPILFLNDQQKGRTAICANPTCSRPYFIRKRRTQKYCDAGPCVEQAQREQKREWWNRNRGKGAKN